VTFINPHIDAPDLAVDLAVELAADPARLAHGGDLAAARRLFPDAPQPFIDLSTGINPHPYPLPPLSADCFTRLPDAAAVRALAAVAARAYGAPSETCVVPAPGTQILLTQVAALAPPGRAAVLGPTYAEHAQAARLVGHETFEVSDPEQLRSADIATVVNPNNPDGRVLERSLLLDIAADLHRRGGLLIIDEAFADVAGDVSLADMVEQRPNIIVLRSFGKFYGLAGLRLGFALSAPPLAQRLRAMLGPWAVSGPAIVIGQAALADAAWKARTIAQLAQSATRLDQVLGQGGLELIGGTSLYRLTRRADAAALFEHLGRAGILVRRFSENPQWLRWGFPSDDEAYSRLESALQSVKAA
jgi:cobalamin biosynthetic protein CobC